MSNLDNLNSILDDVSSSLHLQNENKSIKNTNKDTSECHKLKCFSNGCNNSGKFNCPTCEELNILNENSYYCSKECFKLCWKQHKKSHKIKNSKVFDLEIKAINDILKSMVPNLPTDPNELESMMYRMTTDILKKRHGFTDKFYGKEIVFYQLLIGALYEQIINDGSEDPDDFRVYQLKLFNHLSPQHRLSLLAELSIGLFDKSQPLPSNTLELFSTFYALHYKFMEEIDVEIDMYGDGTQNYQDSRFGIRLELEKELSEEELKMDFLTLTRDFPQNMEASKIEKISDKKRYKRIKKAMNNVELDEETIANEINDMEYLKKNKDMSEEELTSFTDKIMNASKNMYKLEKDEIDESKIEEYTCTFRKAFHDILREKNPNYPSFPYNYPEGQDWKAVHKMFVNASLNTSESDHLIIFNDDSLDVVEATPEALKMYTIIQRRLNKVCKEYEDNWSPSKTVNDIRVLRLIIGPDNWEIFRKEIGVKLIKKCKLVIDAIKRDKDFSDYSHRHLVENLWIGEWHEIMMKKRLDYDNIEDRLKALKLLKNSFIYPDWYKEIEGVIDRTKSPLNWRQHKKELQCCNSGCYNVSEDMKYCGGCKNIVYCSNECQLKHWKIHKYDCNKL